MKMISEPRFLAQSCSIGIRIYGVNSFVILGLFIRILGFRSDDSCRKAQVSFTNLKSLLGIDLASSIPRLPGICGFLARLRFRVPSGAVKHGPHWRRRKALRMLIAAAISTRCGLTPRLRLWARRPMSLMNGSGLLLFGIRFGMPLMMPVVRMERGFSRVPRPRRKMRSRIVGLAV